MAQAPHIENNKFIQKYDQLKLISFAFFVAFRSSKNRLIRLKNEIIRPKKNFARSKEAIKGRLQAFFRFCTSLDVENINVVGSFLCAVKLHRKVFIFFAGVYRWTCWARNLTKTLLQVGETKMYFLNKEKGLTGCHDTAQLQSV
jgi:hypothetical protein